MTEFQKIPIDFKPDFVLSGQLLLSKSVSEAGDNESGTHERRMIYGEITNPNRDEEGEILLEKALDWSYFDTNGWIKYEHVDTRPKHVIGCKHERITTPGGGTIIKGALFNENELADETWELIKSIELHNRMYPDKQKSLGWSIEGGYTDDQVAKGGARKAKVVNVVITPNPINKTVYLKALEANHAAFAKSMNATPVTTEISDKTGGDAITEDKIDKKVKETTEDINTTESKDKKKKRSVMKGVSQKRSVMKKRSVFKKNGVTNAV